MSAYVQGRDGSPTVVVTGCSSGFGHESARLLVARGYRVVATARNAASLAPLAGELEGAPGRLLVRELDVRSTERVGEVLDEAAADGDLEAVVNNAGVAIAGFVEDLGPEHFRELMETNFFGLVEVSRRALVHLRRRGRGTIVQMSSGGGRFGLPMLAAYASSKHAVEGFSEVLRHEAAPWGVRVVMLEPGAFKTRMHMGERRLAGGPGSGSPNAAAAVALTDGIHATVSRHGGEPPVVARAVARSIEASHPRLRRPVGLDAYATMAVKRLLPHRVLELAVARVLARSGYGDAAAPQEDADAATVPPR